MNEFCDNPHCDNPHCDNPHCDNPDGTALEFGRVNGFLREGGFILLAENKEDPNCGAPLEAWAYHGDLNFDTATPMTFGLGANLTDAIGALDHQLTGQHAPPGPSLKCRPAMLLVNDRELATILAALRYHQAENLQGGGGILDRAIEEIATDGGCLETLGFEDVGHLCERINLGDQGSYFRQWRYRLKDRARQDRERLNGEKPGSQGKNNGKKAEKA